jgi:integrase/recombinase XerC
MEGLIGKFANYQLVEKRASAHTVKAYQRDLNALSEGAKAEGLSILALDSEQVRKIMANRGLDGLSLATQRRWLFAVRSFYQFCVKRRYLSVNPCVALKPPQAVTLNEGKVLDYDQLDRILDIRGEDVLSVRDKACFEMLYSSGLRLSELVNLDWKHIDLEQGAVYVVGKGRKERYIPVGKSAIDALNTWKQLQESVTNSSGPSRPVFTTVRGKRLTNRAIFGRFEKACKEAGIKANPHMLRHSFASHLVKSSGDVEAVRDMLGHSDLSATQLYTHLDPEHIKSIYQNAHPRAKKKETEI